jgi:hypothetical protein
MAIQLVKNQSATRGKGKELKKLGSGIITLYIKIGNPPLLFLLVYLALRFLAAAAAATTA